MSADALVHVRRAAAPGAPTLLLLHGRGGAEGDLVGLADALGGGLGLLAPRGPVPQPPGWAWFRHHAVGVPLEADLDARLALVGDWLAEARARHGIPGALVAVGFSNGGMMAGALMAARPELVDAAALLSSAYPLTARLHDLDGLRGRPVFAAGGDDDPFHPVETMRRGVAAYGASGADVEAHLEPGAGHGVTARQVGLLAEWLARVAPRA